MRTNPIRCRFSPRGVDKLAYLLNPRTMEPCVLIRPEPMRFALTTLDCRSAYVEGYVADEIPQLESFRIHLSPGVLDELDMGRAWGALGYLGGAIMATTQFDCDEIYSDGTRSPGADRAWSGLHKHNIATTKQVQITKTVSLHVPSAAVEDWIDEHLDPSMWEMENYSPQYGHTTVDMVLTLDTIDRSAAVNAGVVLSPLEPFEYRFQPPPDDTFRYIELESGALANITAGDTLEFFEDGWDPKRTPLYLWLKYHNDAPVQYLRRHQYYRRYREELEAIVSAL